MDSNTLTGLDRAAAYLQKLEHFRKTFESQDQNCTRLGDTVQIETGRKFDKIYVRTKHQTLGRYMVDRNSWIIYGIKSWAQVNERRIYGTLDTVDEWDWSSHYAIAKPGTPSEKAHLKRETKIAQQFRKRGRPRKNP